MIGVDYQTLTFIDLKQTTWQNDQVKPKSEISEIIGIDIAVVDTSKNQILEHDIIFVKPSVSKISDYCEKCFGVSRDQIEKQGISFSEAYRKLLVHYMLPDREWGSWGDYESGILHKQCLRFKYDRLLVRTHTNIKYLYHVMSGADEPKDLDEVLSQLNIDKTPNVAYNTAQIYLRMARGIRPQNIIKTRVAGK